MKYKFCVICGEKFLPETWQTITCSEKCIKDYKKQQKKEAKLKNQIIVKCRFCNTEFVKKSKSFFCSDECKRENNIILSRKASARKVEIDRNYSKIFQMECPWKSGRLPRSVTLNQCY